MSLFYIILQYLSINQYMYINTYVYIYIYIYIYIHIRLSLSLSIYIYYTNKGETSLNFERGWVPGGDSNISYVLTYSRGWGGEGAKGRG